MKIELAQIGTDPGRISNNVAKIIDYIKLAKSNKVDLIVFPELAIPGYALMDLAYNQDYIEENRIGLQNVVKASEGIAVIVGFIDIDTSTFLPDSRNKLFNSAAIINNAELIGVQHKSLVPDYGIFFEQRYFAPAVERKVFDICGTRIGVQICEDLWDQGYSTKVSDELASAGAKLIVNLSASPFNRGKFEERMELIKKVCLTHKVRFAYTNLVGSYDGYEGEVVFDGRSVVVDSNGEILNLGQGFIEELIVHDLDSKSINVQYRSDATEDLLNALVLGVREYFRRVKLLRAYVGLSGGIDSAVVAYIAALAIGPEQVIGITMPSHITSSETKTDALALADHMGITSWDRPIVPEYNAWMKEFTSRHGHEPSSLTKQNKQARIRGTILMEYANEDRAALILNTGNKTEFAVGYCTLYGDMVGGLAVIGDVSKNRVYELARFINASSGKEIIPQSIIDRVPTAELEEGQTDRANLPADYPILSPLVDRIVEDGAPYSVLINEYPKTVVDQTLRLIDINEFKRRQAPPGIRVTKKAFGVGRRVPMGHGFVTL